MKLNGIEVNDTANLAPQQEDTSWFGPPAFISYSEENGALVVHVTKRKRKGDLAIAVAILVAASFCLVFPAARACSFPLLIVGIVFGVNAVRMTGTTMTVSEAGLSSAFTGMLLKKRADVTWDKAGQLTYLTQTRNRPRGLYAKRSFISYKNLIPYINSAQTSEIIKKVYERFPPYRMGA